MHYAKSNDEFLGTDDPTAYVEEVGAADESGQVPTTADSNSSEGGEAVKTRPRPASLSSVSTGSSIEEQKILLVNKALDDTGFGYYQKSIFLLCGFGYFLGAFIQYLLDAPRPLTRACCDQIWCGHRPLDS